MRGGSPLTDVVRDRQTAWSRTVALPHPNPRNNLWLKRNPWFEAELVPALRARVQQVLALGCRPSRSDRGAFRPQ